jgi:predicted dithiol-disulfide oxidoreductase (DUF899 family)
MTAHKTGTREQWLAARLELLEAEKELTRRSDELARRRQQLPWVPVDKEYVFDTDDGEKPLRDLFGGRSQLLVYHFMFGPEWIEGCPVCSFWADSFDRAIVHLNHRDVTMLCASRAPLEQLDAYKRRMGWSFRWVSALRNDFNYDLGVSFPEDRTPDSAMHNFTRWLGGEEHAGLSAFALEDGVVYHAYSCYARGLEPFNSAYQLLDRAPKGCHEDELPVPPAWIRRHDQCDDSAAAGVA